MNALSVSSHRIELIATFQQATEARYEMTFSILSSDRIDCNSLETGVVELPLELSVSSHRIELIATLQHRRRGRESLPFSILSSDRIDCNAAHSFYRAERTGRRAFSILSSDRIDCNRWMSMTTLL